MAPDPARPCIVPTSTGLIPMDETREYEVMTGADRAALSARENERVRATRRHGCVYAREPPVPFARRATRRWPPNQESSARHRIPTSG